MAELQLDGCTPEPLMNYLKALGVLRLVSEDQEHGDPSARGAWRDGMFVLETKLDRSAFARFFLENYRPTPIVVPWSGGDFFEVNTERVVRPSVKTPTASAAIEAFLATKTDRLAHYRCVILETLQAMQDLNIKKKADIEGASRKKTKAKLLARLRSVLPDDFLPWLDSAAQVADEAFTFNALLGSGGGSDGNTHFSDNFMQNLWDCLPDFDEQRIRGGSAPDIRSALFGVPSCSLKPKRTASLFDSGAVGGPNAGIGMERESLLNPWNFVLAIEGTLCLAGAISKRQGAQLGQAPAFPFTVRMTAVGFGSGVDKEQGQQEIWLPVWDRSLSIRELNLLFGSARCEVGRRAAKTGLDFSRAVASAGVDSGIESFARFGIVRGRVGGENYNTAVFTGFFQVHRRKNSDLIREIDTWLEYFRTACRTKEQGAKNDPPPRFPVVLRRIDTAIFDFCKYGGADRLADVLAALGASERELAVGGFPPDKRRVKRPLAGLSAAWINACDDGSQEYRLARALVFSASPGAFWWRRGQEEPRLELRRVDPLFRVGSIRRYLEPADLTREKPYWHWTDAGAHVVWSGGDVARNLGAVLVRRLMDAESAGEDPLPLDSPFPASLADVAAFLAGETDDQQLADLLWGLMLVDAKEANRPQRAAYDVAMLPSLFALLKLSLIPGPLEWSEHNGEMILGLKRHRPGEEPTGITVKPEPAILSLLRAGRVSDACDVAVRRLRASGFNPLASHLPDGNRRLVECSAGGIPPERFLAAMLFPISQSAVNDFAALVLRDPGVKSL